MFNILSQSWSLSFLHNMVGSYQHYTRFTSLILRLGLARVLLEKTEIWKYELITLTSVRYKCLVLIHSLTEMYSHYSYRKSDIEQLFILTDSFTWEELPTRDPDTGYLTMAGYIPIIQNLTINIIVLLIVFNAAQFTVRILMNHDMFFTSWYPFDVSVSPMYEIANFTQVILNQQLH
jgi:hypothetical protein